MMRYHPWTWRPGTLPGMGAAEWLHDMVNTKRPLEEKMALFWHGIFATGVSKVDHYDDVMDMIVKFREKGLGDFREMLMEMARDPAHDLLAGQLRKPRRRRQRELGPRAAGALQHGRGQLHRG